MNCIYKDPTAPIEARIKDLLSLMTLKEKIGQMTQIERVVATPSVIKDLAIGQFEAILTLFLVCRDPRWGRWYESFGEDPEIVKMMTSMVTGLQGQLPEGHPNGYPFLAGRENVVACAKHFAGDGGTRNGINEGDTASSYDELERIHMVPYLDCIAQGVRTIMASYSSWNGTKLHSSHFLLTEILKGKLGFKGFIISDSEALDRLSSPHGSNYQQSVLSAITAGVDMVMVPLRYQLFLADLLHLVESGKIPITRIDDAVERVLRVKFASGLFENPLSDRSFLDKVRCEEHKKLAREAVRKSLVLLSGGDSTDLKIHFNKSELATTVADQLPTLLILISGRPLVLEPELLDKVEALVAAWLPGSEGGDGIANVIFGDHDFQGRLPMTWFRDVA